MACENIIKISSTLDISVDGKWQILVKGNDWFVASIICKNNSHNYPRRRSARINVQNTASNVNKKLCEHRFMHTGEDIKHHFTLAKASRPNCACSSVWPFSTTSPLAATTLEHRALSSSLSSQFNNVVMYRSSLGSRIRAWSLSSIKSTLPYEKFTNRNVKRRTVVFTVQKILIWPRDLWEKGSAVPV